MCGLYREMHGPITHRRTVALKQTKARKDAVDTLSEESYSWEIHSGTRLKTRRFVGAELKIRGEEFDLGPVRYLQPLTRRGRVRRPGADCDAGPTKPLLPKLQNLNEHVGRVRDDVVNG